MSSRDGIVKLDRSIERTQNTMSTLPDTSDAALLPEQLQADGGEQGHREGCPQAGQPHILRTQTPSALCQCCGIEIYPYR